MKTPATSTTVRRILEDVPEQPPEPPYREGLAGADNSRQSDKPFAEIPPDHSRGKGTEEIRWESVK